MKFSHIDLQIAQNEFDAWVDASRELERAWDIYEAAEKRKQAAQKRVSETRDAFDERLRQEWVVINQPYNYDGLKAEQ